MMPATPMPAISPDNQHRLLMLRSATLLAALGMSLAAHPLFQIVPPLPALLSICATWTGFALLSRWRLRRGIGPVELGLHLAADILLLTTWLAFCGGAANPLTALYLFPVAAAAALLPSPYAWAIAAIAIAAYSLLWPLAVPLTVEDVDRAMQMHLAGMWLSFALSAALLAGIVARMSLTLHEREQRLAAARERALRDERIVALGTLASGAAHSLGTPLNTLALLAGELVAATPVGSAIADDAHEIRHQVERCRVIVAELLHDAGIGDRDPVALQRWMQRIIAAFRAMHPECAPTLDVTADAADLMVMPEPALQQAITDLLENAAEASTSVFLSASMAGTDLHFAVRDHGPGFSAVALSNVGRAPYSEKAHGMGLGLYLAQASVERLGGRLHCRNTELGAEVRIVLACLALQSHP